MKASITGDIIQSRAVDNPDIWLKPLQELFQLFGTTPADWDIYRGDSFQMKVNPADALRTAVLIKAVIKKVKEVDLDVRIAIGIGNITFQSDHVSRSMGDVFLFSGQLLDEMKEKKINLGIKTIWPEVDRELNMMLKLAQVIMNGWTANSAEVAGIIFKETNITQTRIAKRLGIAQSTVNDRIKRGHIYEIVELEHYYRERIETVIKSANS